MYCIRLGGMSLNKLKSLLSAIVGLRLLLANGLNELRSSCSQSTGIVYYPQLMHPKEDEAGTSLQNTNALFVLSFLVFSRGRGTCSLRALTSLRLG